MLTSAGNARDLPVVRELVGQALSASRNKGLTLADSLREIDAKKICG